MKMEGTYEVKGGGQAIGSVTVTRQGLYYHFACRCHVSGEVMFRLIMESDGTKHDLGLLVPMDDCFGLHTRLNIKTVRNCRPEFYLKPNRNKMEDRLISICPEEPFGYLHKLESAFLVRNTNVLMVGFQEEK